MSVRTPHIVGTCGDARGADRGPGGNHRLHFDVSRILETWKFPPDDHGTRSRTLFHFDILPLLEVSLGKRLGRLEPSVQKLSQRLISLGLRWNDWNWPPLR
jgi:hypothetical protein